MSITITTDVFCDFCQLWTYGVCGGGGIIQTQKARKNAQRMGWAYKLISGKMVDICPDCQLKRERDAVKLHV